MFFQYHKNAKNGKPIPAARRTTVIDEIKQLVREKNICVLATVAGDKPYCSLMAYAASETCTEIYLSTLRSTTKFRNLMQNPAVCLLIDTREVAPRSQARALTVEGICRSIDEATARKVARERLLASHPHLEKFLAHPDNEILRVEISNFLLLKGLSEAHHVNIEKAYAKNR